MLDSSATSFAQHFYWSLAQGIELRVTLLCCVMRHWMRRIRAEGAGACDRSRDRRELPALEALLEVFT